MKALTVCLLLIAIAVVAAGHCGYKKKCRTKYTHHCRNKYKTKCRTYCRHVDHYLHFGHPGHHGYHGQRYGYGFGYGNGGHVGYGSGYERYGEYGHYYPKKKCTKRCRKVHADKHCWKAWAGRTCRKISKPCDHYNYYKPNYY